MKKNFGIIFLFVMLIVAAIAIYNGSREPYCDKGEYDEKENICIDYEDVCEAIYACPDDYHEMDGECLLDSEYPKVVSTECPEGYKIVPATNFIGTEQYIDKYGIPHYIDPNNGYGMCAIFEDHIDANGNITKDGTYHGPFLEPNKTYECKEGYESYDGTLEADSECVKKELVGASKKLKVEDDCPLGTEDNHNGMCVKKVTYKVKYK